MSSSEPFFKPSPSPHPEDIVSEADLGDGPADQPDVLFEAGEPEADLESSESHRELPLRKPDVGEKLTVEQLEEELGS